MANLFGIIVSGRLVINPLNYPLAYPGAWRGVVDSGNLSGGVVTCVHLFPPCRRAGRGRGPGVPGPPTVRRGPLPPARHRQARHRGLAAGRSSLLTDTQGGSDSPSLP